MNASVRTPLWIRLSGIAGIVAALAWITGDVLLVGHLAGAADYPQLLVAHAGRVEPDFVLRVIGVPRGWLIAGALVAIFSVPLYLTACWHLWCGVRGAGRAWALPAIALIFCGYALSPLPHAAFYFVGAIYQTLTTADPALHDTLLALADEFHHVLEITWYVAVGCLALGLLWFSAAVATGRSAYPRWFAVSGNPLVLALLVAGLTALLRGPVGTALGAASLNVIWLLVYLQSTLLLWRAPSA
jgi:hypothetical protein